MLQIILARTSDVRAEVPCQWAEGRVVGRDGHGLSVEIGFRHHCTHKKKTLFLDFFFLTQLFIK